MIDWTTLLQIGLQATKSVADAVTARAPESLDKLKANAQVISERANNRLLRIKLRRVRKLRNELIHNHNVTLGDIAALPGATPDVLKLVQDELKK